MPGTIQVSVLEIVGLDSSSPISLVSIKVAIGKKEYETLVIEDFSFPLTSLRDNLIIKFLGAEGKEMSQTGVETKLIVEKGLWDDTFPLEGGGHVHMKLRFLLSAEECDQVRAMADGLLHTACGTPNYVAPEVLNDKGYGGTTSDIWSCGVILFVLMAAYLPFDQANLMELYKKIATTDFSFPPWFSALAKKLIKRILDPNPLTRITIQEILQDEWFKKGYKPPHFEPKQDGRASSL